MPNFTDDNLAHLLRRTEFVVRPERLTALHAAGSMAAAVDDVLAIDQNHPRAARSPSPLFDVADTSGGNWPQYAAAGNWWIDYAARGFSPLDGGSPPASWRALQEKLVLFWHGHFVSSWSQVHIGTHVMWQLHGYRLGALGSFVDLTQQMAISPAMLVYLSNAFNVKGEPNQNFARELMELFTMGVGNYTEAEVDAVARAWTGHNYSYAAQSYVFDAAQHDDGPKTLFGTTKNWNGPDVISEILVSNAAKRAVAARFIARKLWEFLAYVGPSDAIVNALADAFVAGGMQVRPLVRAVLLRDEFYSPTARQGLVRSPLEWIFAIAHHTGMNGVDFNLIDLSQSDPSRRVERSELTGQLMYQPPNVSGWRPNRYWLTASGISGRKQLADTAADFVLANRGNPLSLGPTIGAAVDDAAAYFGIAYPAPSTTRAAIVATFGAEGAPFPNDATAKRDLLMLTMLSPECHLA